VGDGGDVGTNGNGYRYGSEGIDCVKGKGTGSVIEKFRDDSADSGLSGNLDLGEEGDGEVIQGHQEGGGLPQGWDPLELR